MILEGIVTTLAPNGRPHAAPMGPRVPGPDFDEFLLRPFPDSSTFANLARHGEGVLHATDDVLLLARAAVGPVEPPCRAATEVRGFILADCCRWWEFRVETADTSRERAELTCRVVARGRGRDFFGFNRAKHAVLEAAILATRLHLLAPEFVAAEFDRLGVIVDKTGGPDERTAFAELDAHRGARP